VLSTCRPGVWNIPGGDIDDVVRRSALLDRSCAEIGRDPASVIRSIHLPISYDQPSITREAIGEAIDSGFQHIVLGLPAPYPANVARWVTDELITTSAQYSSRRGNLRSAFPRPLQGDGEFAG
jgi:hypothetical protein